jgi:uncharacterized protein
VKILIISDSHGNIANLNHVLGFAKKINVGAVIHCGDWNTLEAVEMVLSFGIPLYSVIGNADIADNIKDKFKESLEVELGGRKIGITHKPSNIKKYFADKKLDIIFCGHYHSKDEGVFENMKIVRPAAIINGNNFAVYNTASGTIEFVNE